MGCGPSRPRRGEGMELRPQRPARSQQRRHNRPQQGAAGQAVSGPTGGPVLIPPPYRDANGMPIVHNAADMDRDTLLSALDNMASYLAQKRTLAQVVTHVLWEHESTHRGQ